MLTSLVTLSPTPAIYLSLTGGGEDNASQWWTHKVCKYVVFVYVQCTTVVSVLQLSEMTHSDSRLLEAHARTKQEVLDSVKQKGTMQA